MRRFVIVLAILLLTATRLQATPPLPDTSTFPNSLGVNIHFTEPRPGELEQIYAAGFRWVRMDFSWAAIERKKGEYDFSAYDGLVAALDAHHMRAYFILDYSNPFYDDNLSPHSEDGRAAFAKWAAASVHHFKGHGVIWEMYNEPNIGFWKPTPSAENYAKLALATGKAIHDSEPGEIYIGPATSTIDMAFLETCFKAGCLEYWSAVSVHPYRQSDPETVADEYTKLRALIARYAPKDRTIPIISGEWGYSSVWKDFDEERQAKYLPRELLTNLANDVPLSIWYDWHEDGKDPKESEHHFGIVRPDEVNKTGNLYEPKKAFLAMQRMSERLAGYHFNKRLAIAGSNDFVLLFDNDAGKTMLVCWTTAITKTKLLVPIVTGATANDECAQGSWEFEKSEKGIEFQPADYPMYLLPIGYEEFLRIAASWSRIQPDVSVAGPALAKVESTLRNPLNHPITLRIGEKAIALKPGEQAAIVSETRVTRSAESVSATVVLDVVGIGRTSQRTTIRVNNPLRVIAFPRTGDRQQLRIENPSGEAFRANATLTGATDEKLEVHAGATHQTLCFTFAGAKSASPQKRFSLTDADGQPILILDRPDNFEYLSLKGTEKPGAESLAWRIIPDGDPKISSKQSLTEADPEAGPPAPGADSIRIDYDFAKGWKFIRLAPTFPSKYRNVSKLGLWLYGDSSGNIARMRFTDSTGQTFQPSGPSIDWTGWKYIEFSFVDSNMAHWGGANDGKVQFPITLDTLFLLDSRNREATRGQIYLSTPTLMYEK